MNNPWVETISGLTCIREEVVGQWMKNNGLTDLESIQKHLGQDVYPGPQMVRVLTQSILGW